MQNIYYSMISLLGLIIHIIVNYDILSRSDFEDRQAMRTYKGFLGSIFIFYLLDMSWGVLAEIGISSLLYASTILYFMSLSIVLVLWGFFVVDYLKVPGFKGCFYKSLGIILALFEIGIIIANFFDKMFFWIDENGVYQTGVGRKITLGLQVLLFSVTTFVAAYKAIKTKGNTRRRLLVICSFGIEMMVAGAVQIFVPVLPIYSMGFIIGCCSIHAFVLEDMKAEMHMLLEKQKERAERSDKAKTNFLFSMSHDIRTPMNAIMGYTQLAKKVADNPAKIIEYLDKIEVAEENLLGLINNVLEMARIENGAVVVNPKPADISKDIEKTLTIFGEMAREKDIKLSGVSDLFSPYVMEDEALDAQIAVNIVSNAIKYTPNGGSVEVSMKQLPGNDDSECILEFKVTDTGIGMSKEFLEHAFENFSREMSSTDSKIPGVGLGLGIVKKLIDQMGGSIEIESEKGMGTTVTVNTHHKFCKKEDVYVDGPTSGNSKKTFKGHRILLVEDNDLNMEIAKGVLEEVEIEVDTASNGRVAIEKLLEKESSYYEMILMDIQMPVMNGYETTRTIRQFTDPILRSIPIVAMTANAFETDRQNAADAGMNDHLAKPFKFDDLLKLLEKYLG